MKKTIISSLLLGTLTTLVSLPAAAEKKQLNPWTDCGIGAMIFNENTAAAAISNVIWDLGTTAVSSNISSQETCEGERAKTAMFIKATMPTIEQELAVGEGEYITAMLELRGCEANTHGEIVKAIREDYVAESANSPEALYNVLEKNVASDFTKSCATNV
ncbi:MULTISPECIES: DUF3015 family protein [unclassified Pseudoalteromonas]|jgi:hypothetical protein|uniref:DUF3015 family protein n=1 Tax=unclassified Pseudoalteromonas TaxID=194690 RepID=UPI0005A74A0D|nr:MULTISPECIES: DUF3015 family protein [unclassified Pseudoalteromonas]